MRAPLVREHRLGYPAPVGYRLVYQSGHGDVWCNGHEHQHRTGGEAGINEPFGVLTKTHRCDCARWLSDDPFNWKPNG